MMLHAQEQFITANNLNFHLIDWSGSGEWLILLHGLASQAHIWDLLAPRLSDTFRVVAIDQRGHGLSGKPDNGYDFATIISDLDTLLKALKIDRALLAGHSWGANVALQYAVDHPERVNGVVLIDGGFLQVSDHMDWPTTEQLLAPPNLLGMPVDRLRPGVAAFLGAASSPEAVNAIMHNFEVRADGTVAPYLARDNHMRVLRALWEHRPSELYDRVQCPVLMIPAVQPEPHDERTRQSLAGKREQIALAEQRLKRSQTIWMTDTIHDAPLQRQAELAETIKTWQVFTR